MLRRVAPPPFGPPKFPAGDDAYQDAPAAPLQQCALPNAPMQHAWTRDTQCIAMLPGVDLDLSNPDTYYELDVGECNDMDEPLPAFRTDTGHEVDYEGRAPHMVYDYTTRACPVAWDVGPWNPKESY